MGPTLPPGGGGGLWPMAGWVSLGLGNVAPNAYPPPWRYGMVWYMPGRCPRYASRISTRERTILNNRTTLSRHQQFHRMPASKGKVDSSYALRYLVAIPSALDTHMRKARSPQFFHLRRHGVTIVCCDSPIQSCIRPLPCPGNCCATCANNLD